MKTVSLFTTRIDLPHIDDMRTRIKKTLCTTSAPYTHIVTLNPEILLAARADERYRQVLNAATYNLVDGVGICFASLLYGVRVPARMTGTMLLHMILSELDARHGHVYLAIYRGGLSTYRDVADALQKTYPHITISGKEYEKNAVISDETLPGTVDVVVCNFGAPAQERFLHNLHGTLVKIGIGVGGACDFCTHKLPRAPRWMRKSGLEWLYRVIKQPRRYKRIMRATIVFSTVVIYDRVTGLWKKS